MTSVRPGMGSLWHYITRNATQNATFLKKIQEREESKDYEIGIQKDQTPMQHQRQQQVVQPRRSIRKRLQTSLFGHPINSSVIH